MKSLSVCFSPTGGGKRIATAIQCGMDADDHDYMGQLCVEKTAVEPDTTAFDEAVPCVFVVPVYGGHMPELAKRRLDNVRADGDRPAILVVIYGNRAFENALTDLETFVRERGFKPIAAAAFVGEHSYSTPETPIAAGRPDAEDVQAAEAFGRLVREKILAGNPAPVNAADLKDEPSPEASVRNFVAFVKEFRSQQAAAPRPNVPLCDKERCSECGICLSVCPTDAIRDDFSVDPSRCIACCACVKACPDKARSFRSPFARPLSENFSLRKSPRWIV